MNDLHCLLIGAIAAPVLVIIGGRIIEWIFPAVDAMEITPPVYDSETDTEWNCTDE